MLTLITVASAVASDLSACPGEGPRYGDYKCNHDYTHRVCAKLVDNTNHQCKPLSWGNKDFWDLTGQKQFEWSSNICAEPNPGDSWCICMWAFARTIQQVGCDNVHIHCGSTDVDHLLRNYHDGRVNLDEAHACIKTKCPSGSIDPGDSNESDSSKERNNNENGSVDDEL
jgi:hypothetical protein